MPYFKHGIVQGILFIKIGTVYLKFPISVQLLKTNDDKDK